MGSETLYFSTKMHNHVHNVGEQLYLPYIKEVTDITESLGYMDVSSLNSGITLSMINKPYSDNGDSLLEYFLSNSVELKEIKVYELRMNSWDEEFINPEPGLLLFHGIVNQITDIIENTFQLSCNSLIYSLNSKFKADTLTKEEYPSMHSSFIGKIPNVVYGKVNDVPCQAIDTGGDSVLVNNISSTDTNITLSDTSGFPNSGKIGIDDEFIDYNNNSNNILTGCTRGAYSTVAVNHVRGVHVWEEKSQFVFMAANHPVKSLGTVRVDDCRTSVGIVKYTGQAGDELLAYPGKAVITADYKQIFKQKVDLVLTDSVSIAASASNFETKYGTSAYSSTWVDGNDQTSYNLSGTWRTIYFSGSRTLSDTCVQVLLYANPSPNNVTISVRLGTSTVSHTYSSYTTKVRFDFPGNNSEGSAVQIRYTGSGGPVRCHQVWKEIRVMNDPIRSGSVVLAGNSSIDTKIGKDFTVDVEGYQDDSYGTITGTPNTLLEYPSDILKHIWTVIFGRDSSEIGHSFSESKTTYITNNYKFCILLNYMYNGSIQDLFMSFALQCKSRINFYRGCLELVYQENEPPTDTNYLAITKDNRCDSPCFERTAIDSITNIVKGFYNLDYTKSDYSDSVTMEDVDSQNKYGKIEQKFDFEAITSQAHATSIANWILYEKKDSKWSVDVQTMSPALGLSFEDLFYINDSSIADNISFHVSEIFYNDNTVALRGYEWSGDISTKCAISIEIEGPVQVDENTITDYSCRVYYNDGSSVVIEPNWQENSVHASISSVGELSTSIVYQIEPLTITAEYAENGSNFDDSHDVSIFKYSGSAGKLFCCCGNSGQVYYTSDGMNWTPGNTTINRPYSLCVFNGKLYCSSRDDEKVYYTSDGINWTPGNTTISDAFRLCVYNGKLYCSTHYDRYVYSTSDGINWISGNTTINASADLCVFNGLLYCQGDNLDIVYSSSDGINWTPGNTTIFDPRALCVFNNKLYCSSRDGSIYYTSGGPDWTFVDVNVGDSLDLFVFNNKLYRPNPAHDTVDYTSDGINWTTGNTNEVPYPRYLAEYDGKLICSGYLESYSTSDGINWTQGNDRIEDSNDLCFYNMT
jgi:hypothetical protein